MKKIITPLFLISVTFLTGCQTTQLGTVTPLKDGYIAEATNNGNIEAARKTALLTAKTECESIGKRFYVIDQVQEENNEHGLSDTEADVTNLASKLLLGKETVTKDRTVKIHFDCK